MALSPTSGNAVTFATPQNYHGSTEIGQGATLLLGTGAAGGDSGLLSGTGDDRIVDDGTLTIRNTSRAISLANISGPGALTQSGAAVTTLAGGTTYTGPTVVSAGTLALVAGSLQSSSGLDLSGAGAALDLRKAGDQTVHNLAGVKGSTVQLAGNTLTVDTPSPALFAGGLQGGSVDKTGAGLLTLDGSSTGTGWQVRAGTLRVGDAASAASAGVAAPVIVRAGARLDGAGTIGGSVENSGTVSVDIAGAGALTIHGDFSQQPAGSLAINLGEASYQPLTVSGGITLAGALALDATKAAGASGQITLIHNTGGRPVAGTFAGLPEGAAVTTKSGRYRISYVGGDGHDVVLEGATSAVGTGSITHDGESVTAAPGARWPLLLGGGVAATLATTGLLRLAAGRRRSRGRRRARR